MADWSDNEVSPAVNTVSMARTGSTGRWESQKTRLTDIFDEMSHDTERLLERVKALESEVIVWKLGYHKTKNDNDRLNRELQRLNNTIDSLGQAGLLEDDVKSITTHTASILEPTLSPPPGLSSRSLRKKIVRKELPNEAPPVTWDIVDTPDTSPEPIRQAKARKLDISKPIYQQTPHLCAFHYLGPPGGCKNGDACERAHDYVLTSQQLTQFRDELTQIPCPMLYKHAKCYNKRCLWKHQCSAGNATSCPRLISGKLCHFEHDSD